MNDSYGRNRVESILDSLNSNKSSTFKSSAIELKNTYTAIMSSLPISARNSILFNPSSLNSQGLALREGLDYLNKLS